MLVPHEPTSPSSTSANPRIQMNAMHQQSLGTIADFDVVQTAKDRHLLLWALGVGLEAQHFKPVVNHNFVPLPPIRT